MADFIIQMWGYIFVISIMALPFLTLWMIFICLAELLLFSGLLIKKMANSSLFKIFNQYCIINRNSLWVRKP